LPDSAWQTHGVKHVGLYILANEVNAAQRQKPVGPRMAGCGGGEGYPFVDQFPIESSIFRSQPQGFADTYD